MNNFPFNLAATAQTVIGTQDFQLQKYNGRTTNAAGYQVSGYDTPIPMKSSVQPVNQAKYQLMGLDFKKSYIKIYSTELIEILSRETNSDRVIYNGYIYEVADDTPWFLSGGWTYVLCARLEKYTA